MATAGVGRYSAYRDANPELQKQKIQLTHRKGYFAKTEKKK